MAKGEADALHAVGTLAEGVPAGWYPDPLGVGAARYWDGKQWSMRYRDAPPPQSIPTSPGDTPRQRPPAPAPHPASNSRRPNWWQRRSNGGKVALVILGLFLALIIAGAASGGSKSSRTSSTATTSSTPTGTHSASSHSSPASTTPSISGAEKEAREYIAHKGHVINFGRVDYEHVATLIALSSKSPEDTEVVDEIAKVAQEAHDEIDGFRQELFETEAGGKLKEATFELSEGANELKNAMGAIVAYTGNPDPATLAHATTQLQTAKSKWNESVEEIWHIANEPGAITLK